MSRILQSIIKSAFDFSLDKVFIFSNPNTINLDLLNIDTKLFSFKSHPLDTNNKISVILDQVVNNNLTVLPDAIICTWLGEYSNAKNLSILLRVPLFNILDQDSLALKKESLLELSKTNLLQDINLVKESSLSNQLFISNFSILDKDIKSQLIKLGNTWTPN